MSQGASAGGWLRRAALAAGAAHVAVVASVVALRIAYPFELEWMEGASWASARRIALGERLYVRPSLDFIPSIYTPLYFWVSGLAMNLFGDGFFPLRLVSALSSIGCVAVVYDFVRRESGNREAAFLAAALFLATFKKGGGWLDLARIDMLFLFLMLLSFHAMRFWESAAGWGAAGAIAAAAYLAKQTEMLAAAPMAAYALAARPRRAAAFIAGSFGLGGAAFLWINLASEGWANYYINEMLFAQHIEFEWVAKFWHYDLALALPLAMAASGWLLWAMAREADPRLAKILAAIVAGLAACSALSAVPSGAGLDFLLFAVAAAPVIVADGYALLSLRRKGEDASRAYFYFFMAAAVIGSAWVSRFKIGAYKNVLIPAFAMLAILAGLAHARIAAGGRARAALWGGWLAQFLLLAYNPVALVPTAADRASGEEIVRKIAAIEGEVFVVFHPYLAVRAGKREHVHCITVDDLIRGDRAGTDERLVGELRAGFAERRWAAVIVDNKPWSQIKSLKLDYDSAEKLIEDEAAFWPRTGWRARPEQVYRPKRD